jgi:hypothetical protein
MRAFWVSIELGLIALLFWLEAGDLLVALRASDAPFAAVAEVPSVPFALLGTLAAVAGLVGLVARRRLPTRVARLLTFAVIFFVAADLASASGRPAMSIDARVLAAMGSVGTIAQQDSSERGLSTDPRVLSAGLVELGPAPFFAKGERLSWVVDVRSGCRGPVADAKGRPPGTVFFCVSDDRQRGWLSVVTQDQTFGDPVVHPEQTPVTAEREVHQPTPGDDEEPPEQQQ